MHPASYGVQKEVEARQRSQRRDARQQQLAKAISSAQSQVGGPVNVAAHAMSWTRGAVRVGLDRLRAFYISSPEPKPGRC